MTHSIHFLAVGLVQHSVSTLNVPPSRFSNLRASLNKSCGSYDSRSKNRLTLSCEMFITSDRRVHVVDFGSLIKNPIYIGNVQCAVAVRFVFLIK